MKKTFEKYDSENPHIWQSFIHFCIQTRAKGFIKYSAKGIFELIRWHTSERGKDHFKVNNIYTPDYARKMENTFPEFKDFFEKKNTQKTYKMKLTDKMTITNEDNMQLMARYPDGYFDLAIVDPPYKIASQNKRGVGSRIDKSGKMNSWNSALPTPEYFKELFRVSKNQIIWGANNYEGLPRTEYFTIWNKEQSVDNFASLEYAWVSMGIGKPAKMYTYSIHQHNHTKGEKIHPTMKPVQLYKYLLDTYALNGFSILDTHLGSGSIAIACHDYGFELTACELDPEYYASAIKRIKDHVSQQKLF